MGKPAANVLGEMYMHGDEGIRMHRIFELDCRRGACHESGFPMRCPECSGPCHAEYGEIDDSGTKIVWECGVCHAKGEDHV